MNFSATLGFASLELKRSELLLVIETGVRMETATPDELRIYIFRPV